MDGKVGGEGGQGWKKRSRVVEMDHQGAFIRRFDSHRICGTFARVVGFRATDEVENFGIRGGCCGIKGPDPTPSIIRRGEGISIRPVQIGAEGKGIYFSVRAGRPFFRCSGNCFASGVPAEQTFQKGGAKAAFELT